MALGVRTRFEVFKRDEFTCQYCGRKSPEVVLEVDHIVAVANGGSDDVINLRTSCWACNSGKSDKPLNQIITGEDPHDRAILLLEKERQLREYNTVLRAIRDQRESDADDLTNYWRGETGYSGRISRADQGWLLNELEKSAPETIRRAMRMAIGYGYTSNWKWVGAVVRNWRDEGKA